VLGELRSKADDIRIFLVVLFDDVLGFPLVHLIMPGEKQVVALLIKQNGIFFIGRMIENVITDVCFFLY
jgi:hypothetical protein